MQKLLTKYGLAFHIACVCLVPVWFLFKPHSVWSAAPLVWLSLAVVEWMILLPSVRRGETLSDARQRAIFAAGWDPVFYIGLGVLLFVGIQCFNTGCGLEFQTDTDTWRMGDPPVSWAPFSVEQHPALVQCAVFAACLSVAVALRNVAGKGAKRMLLQGLSSVSGFGALILVFVAWRGGEPWHGIAVDCVTSEVGMYFGFWMLMGMGIFADALECKQRGIWLLFLVGIIGNLVGVLFFADPLVFAIHAVFAILLFVHWLVYLPKNIKRGAVLKLAFGFVACIVLIGVAVTVLPQNPLADKITAITPIGDYWETVSSRNEVRRKAALAVWQEHMWRGVGPDGFAHFAGLAVKPEEWKMIENDRTHVYNDGVQFLCEFGVIGAGLIFAALVAILIPFCVRSMRLWSSRRDGQGKGEAFFLLMPPVVASAILAAVLCCLESFVASPFRSAALLLAWTCVMTATPSFIPEKINE